VLSNGTKIPADVAILGVGRVVFVCWLFCLLVTLVWNILDIGCQTFPLSDRFSTSLNLYLDENLIHML
jgi:hypothetical protein